MAFGIGVGVGPFYWSTRLGGGKPGPVTKALSYAAWAVGVVVGGFILVLVSLVAGVFIAAVQLLREIWAKPRREVRKAYPMAKSRSKKAKELGLTSFAEVRRYNTIQQRSRQAAMAQIGWTHSPVPGWKRLNSELIAGFKDAARESY